MVKKIQVKSISSGIKIKPQHKYQVRLIFDRQVNLGSFIKELIPEIHLSDIYEPITEQEYNKYDHQPNFFYEVINSGKKEFTLVIGYNEKQKRKLLRVLSKHLNFSKVRKTKLN